MKDLDALRNVLREFSLSAGDLYAHYLDCTSGFVRNAQVIKRAQQRLDPGLPVESLPLIYGMGNPNLPGSMSLHKTTQGDFIRRNVEGGQNHTRAGQLFIVLVYTYWEHEYRSRVAATMGIHPEGVRLPIMGDFRLLRNDIIHNGGAFGTETVHRLEVLRGLIPGPYVAPNWLHVKTLMTVLDSCLSGFWVLQSREAPPA